MDIDDLWFVDQRHPMFHQIKHSKIGEMKVEMMKLSDYVTTTTPIFSKTIKDRLKIKNVLVFPNAVNEQEPQFQPKPTNSNKIEIATEEKITKLSLVNINGQIVKEIVNPIFYQNTFKLNNLPQGFYFLQITAENGILTKKIIVN